MQKNQLPNLCANVLFQWRGRCVMPIDSNRPASFVIELSEPSLCFEMASLQLNFALCECAVFVVNFVFDFELN